MTDNVKSLEEDIFFNPEALLSHLEEDHSRPIHNFVCPECGGTIPTASDKNVVKALYRAYGNYQFYKQRSLEVPFFLSIGIVEDNQETTETERS